MSNYIDIFRNDTISLDRHKDREEFWLHDKTRGMSLPMKAKTEREAFIDALTYYQKRLLEVERKYNDLNLKVENFITDVSEEE